MATVVITGVCTVVASAGVTSNCNFGYTVPLNATASGCRSSFFFETLQPAFCALRELDCDLTLIDFATVASSTGCLGTLDLACGVVSICFAFRGCCLKTAATETLVFAFIGVRCVAEVRRLRRACEMAPAFSASILWGGSQGVVGRAW